MRSCPAVSGRDCSPRRARQQPGRVGQLPDEVGVLGDRRRGSAPCGVELIGAGVGVRHARDRLLLGCVLVRRRAPRRRPIRGAGERSAARSRRPRRRPRRAGPSCDGASTCVARTISSSGAGSGDRSAASERRSASLRARGPRSAAGSRRARAAHPRVVSIRPLPVARSAPRERGAGQQDRADEQQEQHEDVHADLCTSRCASW